MATRKKHNGAQDARNPRGWYGAFRTELLARADLSDPVQRAAYEIAVTCITAIVVKDPEAMKLVRGFDSSRRGSTDPNSPALAFVDIANTVKIAVHVREHRNDPGYEEIGENAVPDMRSALVARFGEGVPSEADLGDWIERHAPAKARGRLTVAGIVAHIVHSGSLLGARKDKHYEDTLSRVSKALSRHA